MTDLQNVPEGVEVRTSGNGRFSIITEQGTIGFLPIHQAQAFIDLLNQVDELKRVGRWAKGQLKEMGTTHKTLNVFDEQALQESSE